MISISKNVLNLSITPPERLPSKSSSPNNQVWNLLELAAIPPAKPNNAPPTGPPGKKNVGIKPSAPAPAPNPPKNVANLGSIPYSWNKSFALPKALPIAPFINFLSPSAKSGPYKNSWKASDLLIIEPPTPIKAPNIGPPGKKNEASTPAPAERPIFTLFS